MRVKRVLKAKKRKVREVIHVTYRPSTKRARSVSRVATSCWRQRQVDALDAVAALADRREALSMAAIARATLARIGGGR